MRWTLFGRVVRIACFAFALAVAHSSAFAEQRFALVIGSNPGWSQDRPLRYADNDAERVRDVLVTLGGFSSDRVELLKDPSSADVRASLRKLAQTVRSSTDDTLVFVYYSGHADDKNLHLRGEPFSHIELQDTLRGLPATIKLAVIDACKSGAVTNKGASQATEFDVSLVNPKLSGMVILTSSGADELSQESRALAGSVFTHHLVSGLRGAADENSDHEVTVSEAYHYAYTRTRADTAVGGTPQRPAFRYELSGQGELVLTRLTTTYNAEMKVPRGGQDKYVVLDSHEWRLIAEAHGQRDRDVVLALAPGSYRVKRVFGDHLEASSMVLAAGDKADVARLRYETAPISAGILKGDPNDLTPAERHELVRSQALGLLAEGQASAALGMFDRLLYEAPGDTLSWRGRGRALVRLAEAYERVSDQVNERRALNDALKADPSLSDDPLFQIWYQRISVLDARAQQTAEIKQKFDVDVRRNPRTVKSFGIGFDLLSGSGLFTANATLVVHRMVFPQFSVDFAGPGIDAAVAIAPFASKWSPYIGLGAHMSAKKMGLDIGGKTTLAVGMNGDMINVDDMWGAAARIEGGAQFVGSSGFTTQLGFAMIMYRSADMQIHESMWPMFHFGWLW